MRALATLTLLIVACAPAAVPAPGFSLFDANPASPRAGQQVSPTDYGGKVTGWYFGHSS